MMHSLPQTWLSRLLLLVCLLVSRSITEEVSERCSHMIGNGHLQFLQQLVSVAVPIYFLPTGETEAGSRVKGKGCRQRNTAAQDMIHGSHLALVDLLGVRVSDPPPSLQPSLTPLQTVDRVGFQPVAWVNDCLECQP